MNKTQINKNEEINLIKADESDAQRLYEMQKMAFADLFFKYKDFETSPYCEPVAKTIERLKQPSTYYYFIEINGEYIGAIRVVDKKQKDIKKRISPIFIIPEHRNKGYAQAAILKAEQLHGNSDWELITIAEEKKNCYLYEKLGYKKTGDIRKVNNCMTLILYEK